MEIPEAMSPKEYLRQLPRLQINIKILTEEIEVRRTKLESTTVSPSGERVQTSSSSDRFADMIAALADKELQQEEMLYIYQGLRDKIVDQIQNLSNPLYIIILYKRYVENRPLYWIAKDTHYSYSHIKKLHGRALQAFGKKYPEEL